MYMAGAQPGAAPAQQGRLVLIRPDGSEGGVHPLYEGENIIGRGQGQLFDSDAYLSPRHGEFMVGPDGVSIKDLRSLNGVFLKITQEEALESGDIFMPDDGTVDNADFPSIWNAGIREGTSLNWAGETQDPLAVYIDLALGIGAPAATVIADMEKHREYLRAKQPPAYPFPVDDPLAAQGEAVWDRECARCHAPGGAYFGRVTAIGEIGTDRERFDTWTAEHAAATNAKALELGVVRKAMVKDVGYANQPLDGIWLRAPYLHNGSVPSLTALLAPPSERPATFWRGCDIYDAVAVGFRSTAPDDDCPNLFLLDTGLRGESNGGHVYGTDLPAAEKAALVEYLKTL